MHDVRVLTRKRLGVLVVGMALVASVGCGTPFTLSKSVVGSASTGPFDVYYDCGVRFDFAKGVARDVGVIQLSPGAPAAFRSGEAGATCTFTEVGQGSARVTIVCSDSPFTVNYTCESAPNSLIVRVSSNYHSGRAIPIGIVNDYTTSPPPTS